VTPEDVKTLSVPVFSHRLVLKNGFAGIDGAEKIIEGIISSVEVPTEEWDR
jgi:MoxR-like ATPase